MHTAARATGVAAMRDVFRAINTATRRRRASRTPRFEQTHDIDKRRWGAARAGTHTATYKRPYPDATVALSILSFTGLTPRLHIDDG